MGAKYLMRNVDALATGGRLVSIGMQGGTKAELDLGKLMRKRASVHADDAALPARDRPGRQGGDRRGRAARRVARRRARRRPARSWTGGCRWPGWPRRTGVVEASEHIGKVLLLNEG